jgi:hypothetical protein
LPECPLTRFRSCLATPACASQKNITRPGFEPARTSWRRVCNRRGNYCRGASVRRAETPCEFATTQPSSSPV